MKGAVLISGGDKAFVSGWGYLSPNGEITISQLLQKTETEILDHRECDDLVIANIYDEQICAFHQKGVGSCDGDSGGPLVVDGELVGVVSWVYGKLCACGSPEIYTNVYLYKDWITANTK